MTDNSGSVSVGNLADSTDSYKIEPAPRCARRGKAGVTVCNPGCWLGFDLKPAALDTLQLLLIDTHII